MENLLTLLKMCHRFGHPRVDAALHHNLVAGSDGQEKLSDGGQTVLHLLGVNDSHLSAKKETRMNNTCSYHRPRVQILDHVGQTRALKTCL